MGDLSSDPSGLPPAVLEWIEEWAWNALVVMFYLPVANGAVLYLWWTDGEYAVYQQTVGFHVARDMALGGASGLLLFGAFAVLTPRIVWLRGIAQGLGQAMGRPSWLGCLLVAAGSAFGEELLFRGVIQARLGIVVGVLAFAFAHVPWERRMAPWPVLALVSGVVFGALYAGTGAVLAAFVAHLVVNLLGLRWIGQRYGRVSASASTGSAR